MPETTPWRDRGDYYILPDDPLAALNMLREAAGLDPLAEEEEPWSTSTATVLNTFTPSALSAATPPVLSSSRSAARATVHALRRSCRSGQDLCARNSLILRGKNESVRPSSGSPSTSGCRGETEKMMSAERGWIGDPQPPKEWHDSHYSRQADRLRRIAERNWRRIEESIRRDEQELAEGDGAPRITGSND